ncbi:hypothetical protein HIM_01956 [Hirsutella minnesotensis 3608]|nr:hypothetical protein HIM_01956 [Hirsutella minnesotensis 3608]
MVKASKVLFQSVRGCFVRKVIDTAGPLSRAIPRLASFAELSPIQSHVAIFSRLSFPPLPGKISRSAPQRQQSAQLLLSSTSVELLQLLSETLVRGSGSRSRIGALRLVFSPPPLIPAMASRIGPRSVKDATRFTSTIPHATSKTAGPSAAIPKPRANIPGETPEQRVRRLRQAHLAAQRAQVSQTDRIIDASRRFLDVAHRWTVGGIVIFTAVAGVVSIYSKKLEADSLSAARIAYLKGEATEEQIALVEEANREAEEKGIKLPPLLSAPEHRTHFEERVKPVFQSAEPSVGKGMLGILSGLWGTNKDGGDDGASGSATATASAEQPNESRAANTVVQSIESTAKQAWETEKENQRKGGSLDQLGLDAASTAQSSSTKKRWWPW